MVRRGGGEVAVDQVRGDREAVAAPGGPHPAWPRHDRPAALGPQLGMDARATIASAGIAMDPSDVLDELTIGGGSPALRA
jgi:hypothetical protein